MVERLKEGRNEFLAKIKLKKSTDRFRINFAFQCLNNYNKKRRKRREEIKGLVILLLTLAFSPHNRTGKLTFEAVGEDGTSGLEKKFLLNGQPEFVVDEQFLSPEGEFVVVHRDGHGWEEILQEMKIKMLRAKTLGNTNGVNTFANANR